MVRASPVLRTMVAFQCQGEMRRGGREEEETIFSFPFLQAPISNVKVFRSLGWRISFNVSAAPDWHRETRFRTLRSHHRTEITRFVLPTRLPSDALFHGKRAYANVEADKLLFGSEVR